MKAIILIISLCCCLLLQAGQVKITGATAKYGVLSKDGVTISAVINGKKARLCKKKRFKRGETYTLKCTAPSKVEYVTLIPSAKDDDNNFWKVYSFIIELPNGEKWQFPEKITKTPTFLVPRGLTFYFTGEFAGQMRLGKHGQETKLWAKGKKLNAPASEATAKK